MARQTNEQFAVAVHALTLLADAGDAPQSSEQLSGSIGSNPVQVRRVLGTLRDAGLVTAKRGVGGGWQASGPARDVRLGAIWRALQGDEPLIALHEGTNPQCSIGRSITGTLGGVSELAGQAVARALDALTVGDVLDRTLAGA
jgi:DNA-binding IscR family transcriptional regulator